MTTSDNHEPMNDFRQYLKAAKELWAWAAGAAIVPFLANFAKLAPPWPPAITYITAVFELIALIWAYQTIRKMSQKRVNAKMLTSLIILVMALVAYLSLFSLFTYEIPGTDIRIIKGYECTVIALDQFTNCPWLVGEDMRLAEYDPNLMWTLPSITVIRISIVAFWLAVFFYLSLFLGAFLVKMRS
jgi:hypothetical protein